MANHQSSRLRLRPSEHRVLLFVGDMLMAIASVFASIYTWREYQRYVLTADGFRQKVIEQLLQNINFPFWFYLLPLAWFLLMIELYEPHTAANWRKTLRGIAIAAFVGLVIYSLVFIVRVDPNSLPRIGVGAFLLYSSLLTLLWRSLYIRFYTSSGQLRHFLVIGAGKAGHTLAEVYLDQNPPPFNLVGFVDRFSNSLSSVKVLNCWILLKFIKYPISLLRLVARYRGPHSRQFWMRRNRVSKSHGCLPCTKK